MPYEDVTLKLNRPKYSEREKNLDFHEIIYTKDDHIATITFNRPEVLNALTLTTHLELGRAIEDVKEDDDVRVLIITGAGRAFCAGDDVKELFLSGKGLAGDAKAKKLAFLEGAMEPGGGGELLFLNKPTIAAVNGAAVGYGCDIALMCDMRIASEKARFGEVFLKVGVVPDQGMLLLPRLIGLARAYEMIYTADVIDAAEADRIGLVNRVVPHEELMTAARTLAAKIAAGPPLATRLAKEGIRRGLGLPYEEFMHFHSQAFQFTAETADHIEASRAFLEKRAPVFKGE